MGKATPVRQLSLSLQMYCATTWSSIQALTTYTLLNFNGERCIKQHRCKSQIYSMAGLKCLYSETSLVRSLGDWDFYTNYPKFEQ